MIVTAIYPNAEIALKKLSIDTKPDLLLIDIGLPGISGIELSKRIKHTNPEIEILIQTVFEDSDTILDAIQAGISGYILKGSPQAELVEAIQVVMNKGSFLTSSVARKILNKISHKQ